MDIHISYGRILCCERREWLRAEGCCRTDIPEVLVDTISVVDRQQGAVAENGKGPKRVCRAVPQFLSRPKGSMGGE